MNKLSSFQSFVFSSSVAIFAITETWLNHSFLNSEILPPQYTIYRHDRLTRRGGVLFAIHSSLSSSLIDSPSDLEVVCVKIVMTRRSFLLCLVYVPPNADTTYHAKLLSFLESLFSLGLCVIILGDFNLPDICWASLSSSNPHSNNFCDFIVTNGLEQLITFPTHSGGNVLDLLLCDSPGLILNLHKVTSTLLSSDHFPIYFELDISAQSHKRKSCSWTYAFKKTDFEGLNPFLLDHDFSPLVNSYDIEFFWLLRG